MGDKLEGLELRKKTLEALGWTRGERFWHHPWCHEDSGCVTMCGVRIDDIAGLPAIESDPAVAIPMLLEWLKRNERRAEITIRSDGETCIDIVRDVSCVRVVMVFAADICEAISLAIVEATARGITWHPANPQWANASVPTSLKLETSMSERDEQNRKLADWLGWTEISIDRGIPPNAIQRLWEKLPDFLASEDASALLFERCRIEEQKSPRDGPFEQLLRTLLLTTTDRKEAVVNCANAFLAIIASEASHER